MDGEKRVLQARQYILASRHGAIFWIKTLKAQCTKIPDYAIANPGYKFCNIFEKQLFGSVKKCIPLLGNS